MLSYKQADTDIELKQILTLQQANLPKNLNMKEKAEEGFVTVEHSFDLLKAMNNVCKHTIALAEGEVVGYALSMHPSFGAKIPVLAPMITEIKMAIPKGDYIIMGQICVAKSFRGKGVFRGLYKNMKAFIPKNFTKIITEVDTKNIRSINAHQAIGFKELRRYKVNDREWSLIVL